MHAKTRRAAAWSQAGKASEERGNGKVTSLGGLPDGSLASSGATKHHGASGSRGQRRERDERTADWKSNRKPGAGSSTARRAADEPATAQNRPAPYSPYSPYSPY